VLQSQNYGDDFFNMQAQFNANVTRFAAFKAYHATQQINAKRADKNGVERSTEAYKKEAQGVLNAFNRYQVAEYNTTVSRTRTAKQWEEFTGDEQGNEIFPYLVWLPSRSVTKREEHIVFYNKYWRKDSPFWNQNQPGNLWNCKCDWQETDGSDGVPGEDTQRRVNHKGLEGNPAVTGEIFSDNATYFKTKEITIGEKANEEYPNLQRLIEHKPDKWRVDYYTNDKGFLAVERYRIEQSKINAVELEKYQKEYSASQTLAINNHKIDFLKEVDGRYDILLDGIPADLKKTKSHNHIVNYARHAVRSQGAKIVVFEFEKMTPKIHEKLNELARKKYKIIYFVSNNKTLHYINTTP